MDDAGPQGPLFAFPLEGEPGFDARAGMPWSALDCAPGRSVYFDSVVLDEEGTPHVRNARLAEDQDMNQNVGSFGQDDV